MDEQIPITLDLGSWTRLPELVEYADEFCGGDLAEAVMHLVNAGLSHR